MELSRLAGYSALMLQIAVAGVWAAMATSSAATPQLNRPWDSPEWKACLASFKRTAKMATYPAEQRLVDGKCTKKSSASALTDEACAMEAVGPSELLKAKGVEVKLVCMQQRMEVMVCTNKKGHYMDAMTSGMPTDKRCAKFPDLLAVNMSTKGPNKALERIFRDPKPQSAECALQVKMIRRLENDPRFDTNQSTREVWANKVAEATRMGCDL